MFVLLNNIEEQSFSKVSEGCILRTDRRSLRRLCPRLVPFLRSSLFWEFCTVGQLVGRKVVQKLFISSEKWMCPWKRDDLMKLSKYFLLSLKLTKNIKLTYFIILFKFINISTHWPVSFVILFIIHIFYALMDLTPIFKNTKQLLLGPVEDYLLQKQQWVLYWK